jgi:hypothetical protein
VKTILANPVMINAYKEGIPGNSKPFPEGSIIVKIEWSKRKNPVSPYSVMVPDTLKSFALYDVASRERQLIWEENLSPVSYACKGKRLHFHELPQKVNGHEACRACHGRPRTEFTYDITGTGS